MAEKNPYLPKYIANAPWYVDQGDDYLGHQRSTQTAVEPEWYDRGKKPKKAATKYRKGACTNCGALTHKAPDCMERPRKVGAKYTGKDIKPDEDVKEINTTWDSKRDRWNGYDPMDYKKVIDQYEMMEQMESQNTESTKDHKNKGDDNDEDDDEEEDENKASTRSVRSLDDKARYLTEMDGETATFNPKTRTLRKEDEGTINERGHFVRNLTGEAKEHDELRKLAKEQADKGENVNLEANPTAGILNLKKYKQQQQEKKVQLESSLAEKYGVQDQYRERPKEVEVQPLEPERVTEEEEEDVDVKEPAQEEKDEEETEQPTRPAGMSRYPEDIFPGNHKSVWGSYWSNYKWGYKCCHSLVKQSYCTALASDSSPAKRKLEKIS